MREIDFLPAEYWQRRASMRDRWYGLAIGAVSLVLLLAATVNQSRHAAHLRVQLASLQAEQHDAQAHDAEIQRLEARRLALADDAKFYTLLRAHPAMSRVMAAVATSCPPRLTLNAIRVQAERRATGEPKAKARRSRAQAAAASGDREESDESPLDRVGSEIEHLRLSLELMGVAESDLEVAELIDRLQRSECFADVKLDDVDAELVGPSGLRKFKVQCGLAKAL